MNQKELKKTFKMISNGKNLLVSMVYSSALKSPVSHFSPNPLSHHDEWKRHSASVNNFLPLGV